MNVYGITSAMDAGLLKQASSLPRFVQLEIVLFVRTTYPTCKSGAIIWDPTWCLQLFALCGNEFRVAECLETEGCNPLADKSEALRCAADGGHVECVRRLIPVSNPRGWNSVALRMAANNGHTDCVRLLIPHSDPRAYESEALRYASSHGHVDCVRELIPYSDSRARNSKALCSHGHTECVRLLAPVSDPRARDSRALCSHGHIECVRLLAPVSDIGRALILADMYDRDDCMSILRDESNEPNVDI